MENKTPLIETRALPEGFNCCMNCKLRTNPAQYQQTGEQVPGLLERQWESLLDGSSWNGEEVGLWGSFAFFML
jgi:hypothetical protein